MVVVAPFMWRHQTGLKATSYGHLRYQCSCGWRSSASPAAQREKRDAERNRHANRYGRELFIRFEIISTGLSWPS